MNPVTRIAATAVIVAGFVCGPLAPVREAIASDAAVPVPQPAGKRLDARAFARAASRSANDFGCLVELWTRESNWNPRSKNRNSTAFGIAQMLNEKSHDPIKQVQHGLAYIKDRYGDACTALRFHNLHGYY